MSLEIKKFLTTYLFLFTQNTQTFGAKF